MGFLARLRELRNAAPAANPVGLSFSAAWAAISGTQTTSSGEIINEQIALQHVTVYVAVRCIAESVGSLTLRLYKRQPKGRQEAVEDPIWRLLSVEPNEEMSAPVMWESIAGCMALTGNAYVEILRDPSDKPIGLYPLSPLVTEPVRLPNGVLAFKTRSGLSATQTARIIAAKDMLHFPLFSWDGLKGLSPVQQCRQSLGLARATEKFGARFFGNGSRPGGILTPVGTVDEQDLINMRAAWEQQNSGDNQGRIGVIPSDWKYTSLSLSPEDSQFLQTRNMSRTDIAAMFRLSPSRVGDTTRMSNGNHEQDSLSLITDTLRPYLVRIEKEILRKLLPRDGSLFTEFDVSERLRGDFKTTMDGFAVGKQWGFYNTNTVLEKLGENPIGPEGDVYWAPVNMVNAAWLVGPKPTLALPAPGGNDPAPGNMDPTPAQRSMFDPYLPTLTTVFADSVGRIMQRSKRDAECLTPIVAPVLTSITSLVESVARDEFGLPDTWSATDRSSRDYVKGLATRAAAWTAETRGQVIGEELSRAVRSLHIGIYREAGAARAQKDIDATQTAK